MVSGIVRLKILPVRQAVEDTVRFYALLLVERLFADIDFYCKSSYCSSSECVLKIFFILVQCEALQECL